MPKFEQLIAIYGRLPMKVDNEQEAEKITDTLIDSKVLTVITDTGKKVELHLGKVERLESLKEVKSE
jgi:hypothetical protein